MTPLEHLPLPLLEWYRDNARDLPWRKNRDPYRIWVSEIMLQQTRVAAVMDYFARFMATLPSVADLAAIPEAQLLKLWQGLGYYSRARNLQKAALVIMSTYKGVFPQNYAAVRALPGIGDYTAGAICSIAFGQATPAVDGNVLRVLARLTGDDTDILLPAAKRTADTALRAVIPKRVPGAFNQALMDLGAMVCLPNGAPLCDRCPARDFCTACLTGRTAELPVRRAKKARRIEERAVFFIFHAGCVALRRRPAQGLLAGLWEYPHELLPADEPLVPAMETPAAPERGPLPAQWGITPRQTAFCGVGTHIFTHMEWRMRAWVVEAADGTLPEGWVWADRAALRDCYAVPSAFSPFSHTVDEHLGGDLFGHSQFD